MSKNKFFKKLLVAGLCALTATATIGTAATFAGCKENKKDDEQTQIDEYTVTFKLGYEGAAADTTKKVEKGGKVSKPEDPTREGYTFGGWILADGTVYNFDAVVSDNITLTAKWTKVESSDPGDDTQKTEYTITWDLNYQGAPAATTSKVKEDEKVSKITNPSRTGYEFICWLGADNKEYDFNTAVKANLTLKAKWEKLVYTVTFKYDDTVFDIQHVRYEETASTIATDPAKPGKIFAGWVDADGDPFDFNTEIIADTVITASWSDKSYASYTVSFEANGGSAVEEQNVTIGGKAEEPTAPTKENFEFAGWYVDEQLTEEFDFDTTISKAIKLYAKWTLTDGVTAVTEASKYLFGENATADEPNNIYALATGTTVQGSSDTFGKLTLDATTGKISNGGRGDQYCQFNTGAVISFYVDKACNVKVTAYDKNYSVNGTEADNQVQTFEFAQAELIQIAATGNTYIVSVEISYPEAGISSDVTWSFKGDTANAADDYFIYDLDINGNTVQFNGLTIDGTAGKVTARTQGDTQINNGGKISFNVSGACSITISTYANYHNYTLNGTAAEQDTQTFDISKAGKVEFVATNTMYLYSISVTFASDGDTTEIPANYELVKTSADLTAAQTMAGGSGNGHKVGAGGLTVGKFTFSEGAYFDTTGGISGTVCNNQKTKIYFDVTGYGNKSSLTFDAKGASSGTLKLYKDGKVVKDFGLIASSAQLGLTATELEAGSYYLWSEDGAVRIGNILLTEYLEKGELASLELKPAKVDFLAGNEFTSAGLSASAVYSNGSKRSQSNITVDSSSVDTSKEGEYVVRVFYTEGGETATATYTVKVYTAQSINIYTYTTSGTKQTNLKKVYVKGGSLDTAGLTAKISGTCGDETLEFTLASGQFDVSTVDLSTVGEKTVTVSAKGNSAVYATYTIYVVEKAAVENNTVTVSVDATKDVSSTNFKTITDALVYLSNYDNGVVKAVNIADGEYNEKVIVNIPNVQLIGSATNTPDADTNNGVVITYDALAGKKDPAGAAYGTNGSATVTVTANGFVAKNITFKNYYNTNALYNESKELVSDTQAVALYVESDKAEFYNCKMTGYHDTLYANKGKQYYYNCWIEGRTDYIFGQDAIVYFNGCTINTVSAGSDDGNGGYVVALKPSKANTYYFVFNNCDFTGPATGATNIALGRAWGADMKMVVMNSSISSNYSTAQHTAGTTKGQRYCTMSGNEPKASNMLEYNNTGASKIDSSIADTCTVIDATAAAAYDVANLSTMLGFTPEKVN